MAIVRLFDHLVGAREQRWRHVERSEERRVGKECRCRCGPDASSRRRHTICLSDWSSDVCSSDLLNRCCAFVRELESMCRDKMLKILLQQNLPLAAVSRCSK